KMYDWYCGGKSLRWIAKTLTSQGILTPRGKRKGWDPTTVRKILANPVYKGTFIANRCIREYVWDGGRQKLSYDFKPEEEWIDVSVPAIISEDQWDEVQRRLSKNKRLSLRNSGKHQWLLSQVVRCVCGNHYYAEYNRTLNRSISGEGRLSETYIYRCSGRNRVGPTVCRNKQIRQDLLEPLVLKALEQMIFKVELWDEVLDSKDDQRQRLNHHVTICQKQIAEIDEQLEELLQLVLEQRTKSTRQLFLAKQGELESQRQEFEKQLRITQERLALVEETSNRKEALNAILAQLQKLGGLSELPFTEQRRLVTLLVDEIVLDTSQQWFEIRGELNDRFDYTCDEGFMLTPGLNSPCH
ncbi:MAG: recombinase family protein, partial [Caldilineaceae bacterium]|nr:recombinase family protein [Caldilineaceae bacterium]